MEAKIKIYIAAPYSSDPEQNTLRVLKVADRLLEMGYIPFVPHLSHYWDKVSPKPWETWIEIDRVWLRYCNVLLRLTGESNGADGEVKDAVKLHIPIFFAINDELTAFEEWVKFREIHKKGWNGVGDGLL